MSISNELLYLVALSFVPGIGPSKAKNLLAYFGSAEAIFKEKKKSLLKVPDIGPISASAISSSDYLSLADEELRFCYKQNLRVLPIYSDVYPSNLKQCSDGPIVLFFRGELELNHKPIVALVGTRNATSYGKKCVDSLIEGLLEVDPIVVSGLAYGIDIYSHRLCLDRGLSTVACLAHGLDRIYPPTHVDTAKKMCENNGGLLTEFPTGTRPDRELFPSRNRIIAGMSDCTVVVETDKKGGSIITAHLASDYGREVFAFPGRIDDRHSLGCNELIKKNIAALIESPLDLLQFMQWSKKSGETKQSSLFEQLSDLENALYRHLRSQHRMSLDSISQWTRLNLSATNALLLEMEFKGAVRSLPGKLYETCGV